jgi:deoxyribonuclease-4
VAQRFGAHVSIAGGVDKAVAEAERLRCDGAQIFVKNQKQWRAPPLTEATVRAFHAEQRRTKIKPVFAHASYLINLAAPGQAAWTQSIAAMVDELERCEALGLAGLVVHPGAHVGSGVDAGIARIIAAADEITARTAGFRMPILLEGTAGQGSAIGAPIEELGRLLRGVRDADRVGICLDTCHLFAAGYDLRNPDAFEAMMALLKRAVTLKKIACLHANDSKTLCGSHVDRHAHIGHGQIGRAGFLNVLHDRRLAKIPRIIETDKAFDEAGREWDVVNLATLRRLAGVGK